MADEYLIGGRWVSDRWQTSYLVALDQPEKATRITDKIRGPTK